MILHDALECIGQAVHRVWLVRLGLDRLWLARLAAPPGLGSSRDHSKCQTCLPAVSWVSPVCLRVFPDAPRLSPGCLPAVSWRSPGCLPAVSRLSPGCLPAVSQLSPSCLPAVSRLFPGCLPGVSRLSPGCMSPGCLPAVSRAAVSRLSLGHRGNTGATLGQHWGQHWGNTGATREAARETGRLPAASWSVWGVPRRPGTAPKRPGIVLRRFRGRVHPKRTKMHYVCMILFDFVLLWFPRSQGERPKSHV